MIAADLVATSEEDRFAVVDPFTQLDSGDATVHGIVSRLRRVARADIPVLLRGETGTGKELFARAIHRASGRTAQKFIAVNCASIPESLIESELFGYRAGAFTGASARGGQGLVQQADGGTLFLDEIGDMPLALQTRLLRVLAEGEFAPLGAGRPVKVDLRVVCATHHDLEACVRQGHFREDLLFRLHGLCVVLPPLRRRSDISAIATRILLEQSSKSGGRSFALSGEALALCQGSLWPGNIRQLKQALQTASVFSDGGTITACDLSEVLSGFGMAMADNERGQIRLHEFAEGAGEDARSTLLSCLRRNQWNISKAATEIGASRTTIYRRMARLAVIAPHLRDL